MHSIAQTDDPYFNAGYLIGSAIRQGVDNYRSRQAEQERIEREREEADRAYRLEQQRIANFSEWRENRNKWQHKLPLIIHELSKIQLMN